MNLRRALVGVIAVTALTSSAALAASGAPFSTLTLTEPTGAADADSGGFASDNVEWVTVMPQHAGTSGGKLLGKYYYLTDPRGVYIYDVSDPAAPQLVGQLLAAQVGTGLALAQEDPDTNGKILVVNAYNPTGPAGPNGTGQLLVVDVKDKSAPTIVGSVAVSAHTWTCLLDCKYAIGRDGGIVDLRDPSQPEVVGNWRELTGIQSYVHDFEEVRPGRVIASGQPSAYIDVKNPLKPKVLTFIESEFPSLGYHGADWANGGKDPLLVMGAEVTTSSAGGDCTDEASHAVATYDATDVIKADRANRRGALFRKLQEWRVAGRGVYADGNAPAHALYCGHWFDTHPKWRAGGVLALGHYTWGTRFLEVDRKGGIEQIGYFQPVAGYTSAAKWITDEIVYVHDYTRGLDVLRFTDA